MKRPMNGHKISRLFFGPPGDTASNESNDHEKEKGKEKDTDNGQPDHGGTRSGLRLGSKSVGSKIFD